MSWIRTNGGQGSGNKPTIFVEADAGSTVTAQSSSGDVINAKYISPIYVISDVYPGNWTISITKNSVTKTHAITVTAETSVYYLKTSLFSVPSFSYSGNYQIVNDNDAVLTDYSKTNWKIRFLTSGTLKFNELNGADEGIDVFLVGGGGHGGPSGSACGGGGGGYTQTHRMVTVEANREYQITIGGSAGATSGFGYTADPGESSSSGQGRGSNGGSGGGAYSNSYTGGAGGSDGGNGYTTESIYGNGGTGQGSTTREFGSATGKLYAGGGGGGTNKGDEMSSGGAGGGGEGGYGNDHTYYYSTNGDPNTGGGGGGGPYHYGNKPGGGSGGSGILIIRNARG